MDNGHRMCARGLHVIDATENRCRVCKNKNRRDNKRKKRGDGKLLCKYTDAVLECAHLQTFATRTMPNIGDVVLCSRCADYREVMNLQPNREESARDKQPKQSEFGVVRDMSIRLLYGSPKRRS